MESIVQFIELNFTLEGVIIAIKILMAIIVILAFAFIVAFTRNQYLIEKYNEKFNQSMTDIEKSMQTQKWKSLNYEYIKERLRKNGINFKFKNIDPLKYILINVCLSVFIGWFCSLINLWLAIPGLFIGYKLFDWYITYSNSSDNKDMMMDIKSVFTTLKMQTQAGMYITSALTEAFTIVKNPRLKSAILELSGDIINNKSISTALDTFNGKFNNTYIDSLAVIIKQSSESGKASSSFKDIEVQLDEIQSAIVLEEKKRIQMNSLVVQFMIYGAIIFSILYSLVLSIANSGLF